MDLSFLISNPLINAGVVSWLCAQSLKALGDLIKHRKFDKRRLAGAGGMPSSHSAVTCSVALTALFQYGFDSPIFALAFILAFIVMYDAMGVRWHAGLHAKAINHIVEFLEESEHPDREMLHSMIPTLNESLGHRAVEVICGGLLGVAIAVIGELITLGGIGV